MLMIAVAISEKLKAERQKIWIKLQTSLVIRKDVCVVKSATT